MRQRVCVNERDRNNVCKIEIEIMYLDEKETLRMSSHQWDKEYVWIRETEIMRQRECVQIRERQKECVWIREKQKECV